MLEIEMITAKMEMDANLRTKRFVNRDLPCFIPFKVLFQRVRNDIIVLLCRILD